MSENKLLLKNYFNMQSDWRKGLVLLEIFYEMVNRMGGKSVSIHFTVNMIDSSENVEPVQILLFLRIPNQPA